MSDDVNRSVRSAQDAASVADAAILEEQRRLAAERLLSDASSSDETSSKGNSSKGVITEDATAEDRGIPLFEAVTSPLGGDVDAAGDRLIVWQDRVEHFDGKGRLRESVPLDDIDEVVVKKRLTSAVLSVNGAGGVQLRIKGVKSSSATRFRDAVATIKLVGAAESGGSSTATALKQLDRLAAIGLLTDKEIAEKRAMLVKRY